MRSFRLIPRFVVLVVVGTTITLGASTATAAACKKNIAVTDAGDAASPTSGQLRTAIAELCSGGTILLPAGVIIDLAQGELVIPSGKVLTIRSPSHQQQGTIDAQGTSRVFWVHVNASLALRNVIVRGGDEAGINNDGSLTVTGGAVRNNAGVGIVNNASGLVTLSGDTSISGNQGSGVFNRGLFGEVVVGQLTLEDHATITANVAMEGGGIWNGEGTVTLNDESSVYGNTAILGGGIFGGRGLITLNDDSTIRDNEADEGGGIFNPHTSPIAGNVLNDRSRIVDNVAHVEGGGIGGRGGITLNDESAVAHNVGGGISNVRGGVILNDNSGVVGNEGVGVDAFGVGLTMNDQSHISDNTGRGIALVSALGILNDESRVRANGNGGIVLDSGLLTLNGSSSVSGNTTQEDGGGILFRDGWVRLNDDSSIAGNVARFGGGIYNSGGIDCPLLCVILNGSSTVTGNVATGGVGGGIYNDGGSVIVNDNGSITGNSPDDCYPAASC